MRQTDDRLCGLVDSSWLQIQRSGFDSRRYRISWEIVVLERGRLSLVGRIEELVRRKNTAVGIRRADQVAPCIRKSLQKSPRSGGRSVGIVLSRPQATKLLLRPSDMWPFSATSIRFASLNLCVQTMSIAAMCVGIRKMHTENMITTLECLPPLPVSVSLSKVSRGPWTVTVTEPL
jgi:hypothetical protein